MPRPVLDLEGAIRELERSAVRQRTDTDFSLRINPLHALGDGLVQRQALGLGQHHVGAVLSKLELRGRSEAAAYAVRQIERDSAAK